MTPLQAWWKANSAEEAVALLKTAFGELNQGASIELHPHAVLDAPGALFVEQKGDVSGAQKTNPVDIVHKILESMQDPTKHRMCVVVAPPLPLISAVRRLNSHGTQGRAPDARDAC